MGIYYSSRSGGPCWTRERGYHQPDPPLPHIVRIIMSAPPAKPPCTVCGTAYEKHGSYPTCASHTYTPDSMCQYVIGAACVGAECKAGCVRARNAGTEPGK